MSVKDWLKELPKEVPIVIRDDGFSQFYEIDTDKMSKEYFLKENVDYLEEHKPVIKEFGLGPGSVFTFDTKTGDVFGEELSDKQRAMLRLGDIRVWQNVMNLIRTGNDPLRIVAERCHEIGMKTWARLEMNHEYGPAIEENWEYVGFVGSFNKNNSQYRIGDGVRQDFKFKQVREFKLGILREAAQRGVDGISLDFCVYPPYLSDPINDAHIMTQFIRDIRKMLDEVSQAKRIDLIVRVPYTGEDLGLEWKTWIDEDLIDYIIPSVVNLLDTFDVPIEEFVKQVEGTNCKVFGCIRPCFGSAETDPEPGEEEEDLIVTDRPVSAEMYYARLMLLLKAGVHGIQIALGSGNIREWNPIFNTMGIGKIVEESDKEYFVNRKNQIPFELDNVQQSKKVNFRIGDELTNENLELVVFSRGLEEEKIELIINNKSLELLSDDFQAESYEEPVDPNKMSREDLFVLKNWWDIGKNQFSIPQGMFKYGENIIEIKYSSNNAKKNYIVTEMSLKVKKNKI